LLIKQYILEGVDPLPSLQGITVTGGRLNIHNAIANMLNPSVSVSPSSISVVLPENATDEDIFSINNLTIQEKAFSINTVDLPNWLSVSPASGVIPSESSVNITVYTNSTGLDPGNYSHSISISVEGQPLLVSVSLATPILMSDPMDILMRTAPGSQDNTTFELINNLEEPVDYTITIEDNPIWLSVDQPSGSIEGLSSEDVLLLFDTQGIVDGIYTTTLLIDYLDYTTSIPVTLYNPHVQFSPASVIKPLGPNVIDESYILMTNLAPIFTRYQASIQSMPSWINFEPDDSWILASAMDTMFISLNTTGLAEGVYNTEIEIIFDEELPLYIPIELQLIHFGVDEIDGLGVLKSYPNPFSESVAFEFELDEDQDIHASVYDQIGNRVRTIANQPLQKGIHTFTWDGCDASGAQLSNGIYYFTVQGKQHNVASRKIVLLK